MNRSESRDIGCFMSAISRVFCEMYFFNKNNSIKIFYLHRMLLYLQQTLIYKQCM